MNEKERKCQKCGGEMELGSLINTGHIVDGPLEWEGTTSGLIFRSSSDRAVVNSYRCFECGYLENYAPSQIRKERKEKIIERKSNPHRI